MPLVWTTHGVAHSSLKDALCNDATTQIQAHDEII
jgi:hypothetical protein